MERRKNFNSFLNLNLKLAMSRLTPQNLIVRGLALALFAFGMVGFQGSAHAAEVEHLLIRRLVVFPIKILGADPNDPAIVESPVVDEAWWQSREELAHSHRFLVASKQFLVRSDAFQPRGELQPSDAIILGKLLDAHALVTWQLKGRELDVEVYDAQTGLMLWMKNVTLHPSLTVADQLAGLAKRLMQDFMATIPYQGFTIVDSLVGKPAYSQGDLTVAQVDLGVESGAQTGDIVQWVRILATTAAPFFQGGSDLRVFAEGRVLKLDHGIATVQVVRADKQVPIRENSLVRVPRDAERLINTFTIRDALHTSLTPELAALEANPMEQKARERRPLLTTLSVVGSVVAFLLLAF